MSRRTLGPAPSARRVGRPGVPCDDASVIADERLLACAEVQIVITFAAAAPVEAFADLVDHAETRSRRTLMRISMALGYTEASRSDRVRFAGRSASWSRGAQQVREQLRERDRHGLRLELRERCVAGRSDRVDRMVLVHVCRLQHPVRDNVLRTLPTTAAGTILGQRVRPICRRAQRTPNVACSSAQRATACVAAWTTTRAAAVSIVTAATRPRFAPAAHASSAASTFAMTKPRAERVHLVRGRLFPLWCCVGYPKSCGRMTITRRCTRHRLPVRLHCNRKRFPIPQATAKDSKGVLNVYTFLRVLGRSTDVTRSLAESVDAPRASSGSAYRQPKAGRNHCSL